jgi:hypothetical protein
VGVDNVKDATVENLYAEAEKSFAHWETTKDLITPF